jgi:hypothetical protein
MKSTSNSAMKQADLGLHLSTKRTRKREFLDEMERVVPWADLVALIAAASWGHGVMASWGHVLHLT